MATAPSVLAAVFLSALRAVASQQVDVTADAVVAGSAGGWLRSSPASDALEALLGDDTCTIERRTVESLAEGEFQRDYFQKKAVLLRFESAATSVPAGSTAAADEGVTGSDDSFMQTWSVSEVKEWLLAQGMADLAGVAFKKEVDGLRAVEMDASDWSALGASTEQVTQISRVLASARVPVWSREGLKQHCGEWEAQIATVRAMIASDGGDVKVERLSDYLDHQRDNELKGIVQGGGLNNTTDPIEMQAAQTERKDANYYCFFGPPLFDHCKAAAAGIPAAVQQVVNLVAAGDQTMLQDFIDNPQLVLGGSGSGFPFHQHGEAVLQLLTGRKRWWLLDGAQIPPSGYRYDMSQLQWVQYVLPKLHVPPQVGKPSTCTQEPGEVMYVPDSFWHATLNIGETLAVGAQAGQDGWEVIHKDRGALINEVLIASQSQQQQVSAKQARKLVTKVDRMLRQYGANSHLLDAKAGLLAGQGPAPAGSPTDKAFLAAITADPVSESTVEKYAMWLSGQNDRFNDALAQWFALVKLGPLEPGPYLYWASMMLMPSNPSTGGFNLSPKGLKIVADTLRKAVQRILSRKKDPPLWAAGTVVDIESEDGLESGATVLGPSENGDQSERRVEFKDGAIDDWPIVDFRKPWAVGDIVDIDTEDGWEGGAKVLGPSHSGDALELHVEFADGTVDDWATADFRRPAAPTDFSVGSKEAVVQKICNAGVLVYAVAGVTGGREIIDECKQFGIGLTVTAADLKLSVSERAAKGRAEIKASLQALRAAENPAFAAIEQAGVGDDAIGKAVLTTEGATKVLQKMAEREYPLAYVAAAKQGRRIEVVPNAPQASGGDGGGGSTLGSLSGPGRVNSEGFDTSADDRGGWGGGCAAAAAAATAEIGCDFDRRFVSVNGGQDGGLTPVTFVSEYVAKMKPVILRTKDAKGLLKDWEAWKIWSRKGMLERYGSVKVNISASSSIVKLRQGGDLNADMRERTIYQTELSEYINEVMGRSGTDRSVLDEKDPPYLFRARQLPGLQQDYGHLELFNDTKVFHHDRATRERIALFFVGPSNSGAHFHQHMNAYNALVYGAKRWFVLPPQADKGEGQPSMLDWVEKVLPTLEVPPLQCVQHAGEVVYVPTGWWHGILNLCDSVGVAFEVGIERSVLLTT